VHTHHNVDSCRSSSTRISLLAGAVAALLVTGAPVAGFMITPAQAQASISVQFRTALQDHGRWARHSRWGEVWIPANRPRDWRPYTNGHWVYTDEWGWYWIEDDAEASWGLVTNHYGRWVYDDELEWCWVAGEEWGPAWVQWRRSDDVVGWAALPPDDVVVEYRESPRYWAFVRARDFVAPRAASVIISEREYPTYFRQTVVVNRSVIVSDRGPRFAVNPGIPAAFIAARVGRPLRTFEVQPRVLAGTAQIPNAVVVREQDLRSFRAQATVRETRTEIRPSQQVAPPRELGANERGRLGDNPPRAAQGPTQGRGPAQGPTEGRGPGEPKQQPGTQGRGEPKQKQLPSTEGRGPGEQKQLPGTQGRGPGEQKQLPGTEGRGRGEPKQQPGTEGRGEPKQKQQQPGTEGRGRGEPKQQFGTEGRGEPKQQPGQPKQQPGTEGRGRGEPKQLPGTEGRGGQPKQQPGIEGRGGQPKQQLNTEGRGRGEPNQQLNRGEPRQQMNTEGRGRSEPRPPSTDGRGGGQQPGAAGRGGGEIRQQAPQQQPRTEGRGGGGPQQPQQQAPGRGGGQPKQPGER
jgi:hypothetical protein